MRFHQSSLHTACLQAPGCSHGTAALPLPSLPRLWASPLDSVAFEELLLLSRTPRTRGPRRPSLEFGRLLKARKWRQEGAAPVVDLLGKRGAWQRGSWRVLRPSSYVFYRRARRDSND
ncbi:hypothetical protein AAFF_G00232750 [Aldrovandia affinis]|uniref:Uncharacterized protein n=1 Tax=Aldrovandia affinis TaxID=143900 RepID=A0AAD7W4B1_9TELE|nr:hypothetical protein AAFF_G00232750 [Aldrovandia affinis]